MRPHRRNRIDDRLPDSRWSGAAVGTVVLLVASVVPSPLERRSEWDRVGPDKFLHLVGHAMYAATVADAFDAGRCTRGEAAVLAVCVSTAHSLVTGRLQTWVPGRAFELADVVAGLLGTVVAVWRWYVAGNADEE
ncbi:MULTISPECIES: VanZ family protein [Salinibaculum]|uniref:VanZ family protein n=1 Tax=Salinibaculum TaxID=2732368 RepID=UPI0030CBD69C